MTDNRPIHVPEYDGHAPDWYKEGMLVDFRRAFDMDLSKWNFTRKLSWLTYFEYRPAEPLEPSTPVITFEQAIAALEAHGIDTSSIPKPVDPLLLMLREVASESYNFWIDTQTINGERDQDMLEIAAKHGFVPGGVK